MKEIVTEIIVQTSNINVYNIKTNIEHFMNLNCQKIISIACTVQECHAFT